MHCLGASAAKLLSLCNDTLAPCAIHASCCPQRVSVPTPAGQPDSCAAAVAPPRAPSNRTAAPPRPTSQPIPSTPSSPTAGVATPSSGEQPASPVCPQNATSAVLCPPVRLPAPLDQTPTSFAVNSSGSSRSNMSVVAVEDGSRGMVSADGTSGGGTAQVATPQQQQAAAAVTLRGMWLSDNGSTVYMCMASRPGGEG